MLRPFVSFALAIKIYLTFVFILTLFLKESAQMQPFSLEFDAEILNEVANHHQQKNNSTRQKNIAKIAEEKKENARQEKTEPPLKNSRFETENESHSKAKIAQDEKIKNITAQKIAPIFRTLPEIPQDLRYEAFHAEIEARFQISKEGRVVGVELIKASNNVRLNYLLIKSLKKWLFDPSLKESSQDIKVVFTVK
jgi:outer membrane biosynthesis protein TonB